VVKNKMAPRFKVAEFDIMYNEGISRTGSILDVATDMGIIEKRGSWFSFDGEQLGQGRDQTKQLLADNPELQNRINDRIKERIAADKAANVPAKNAVAAETAENN
jgi:recombination protein RecA